MTNPTSNFGWQMPTPTDLVTDLPADFEVFGQAVDTSMADLKGGTTGQILSKATNADMDFTWITNDVGDITAVTVSSPLTGGGTSGSVSVGILNGTTSNLGAVQLSDSTSSTSTTLAATANAVKTSYDLAAAAIPKSTVTTAGDVIYATGSAAVTRLGIGTAGQVLKVNSGATAPEWATPSSSSYVGVQAYRVVGDGSLTFSAFTNLAIPFVSETFDTDTFHSTSTNTTRFTVPAGKAGKYIAVFGGRTTAVITDFFQLRVLVNGASPQSLDVLSENQTSRNLNSSNALIAGSQVLNLAVSDYVEFCLRPGNSFSSTVDAWFSLSYLGA